MQLDKIDFYNAAREGQLEPIRLMLCFTPEKLHQKDKVRLQRVLSSVPTLYEYVHELHTFYSPSESCCPQLRPYHHQPSVAQQPKSHLWCVAKLGFDILELAEKGMWVSGIMLFARS